MKYFKNKSLRHIGRKKFADHLRTCGIQKFLTQLINVLKGVELIF